MSDWVTTAVESGQVIPFGAVVWALFTGKIKPGWTSRPAVPDAASEFDRLLQGLGWQESKPPRWYRLRKRLYSDRRWTDYTTKLAAEWRYSPKEKPVEPQPIEEIRRTAGPTFGRNYEFRTTVEPRPEPPERPNPSRDENWLERKAAYDEGRAEAVMEMGQAEPVDYIVIDDMPRAQFIAEDSVPTRVRTHIERIPQPAQRTMCLLDHKHTKDCPSILRDWPTIVRSMRRRSR